MGFPIAYVKISKATSASYFYELLRCVATVIVYTCKVVKPPFMPLLNDFDELKQDKGAL